ncbi:GapR family DNA-binding domain-containing protein [uncultured Methylobacterium sp.]|uniref:DUF2312 domain-containing protein n=1 Tax=uncultured Methylobacterium sp. TaxID=157278 RepID=UPI002625765D|nr:GapR family DNA-binding domain-containing protein [uncultured Methylobacterium sp.]
MPQDTTAEVADSGVSPDELKQFVERAERVQEEIDAAKSDLKEIKLELKGRGFDLKAFNAILKLRKQDRDQRMEEEAILELYKQALGLA